MEKASLYAEAEQEAVRFRWSESEKVGRDLGDEGLRQWVRQHWAGYLRSCWLEHLQGKRFWIELDHGDFGLLQREFRDNALLLDRVLDRLLIGQQNLDVVLWATEWGIPTAAVAEILTAVDLNSRRLSHRLDFGQFHSSVVKVDPTWLTWEGGCVPRLARGIAQERAFDVLPVLADALEEAGCTDATLLDHCRASGRHTSWCWVVELLLGRL